VLFRSIDLPEEKRDEHILQEVERLATGGKKFSSQLIIVSNEVGMGMVPDYPLGRAFRDLAGRANQILARQADQVYFVIAGLARELKSG